MSANKQSSPIKLDLDFLNFFDEVNKLKRLKRTGWVLKGVTEPESVAEHSFRTAILALTLSRDIPHVNTEKLVKMALVHDLGEIIVGDIRAGIEAEAKPGFLETKYKAEDKAFKKLLEKIPKSSRDEIYSLWIEYEQQKTEEAKWLLALDKFEMVLQALEYEKESGEDPKKFDEFWEDAKSKIKLPEVMYLFEEAMKLRKKK